MQKLRCHYCKQLFEIDEKELLKSVYCPNCGALQDIPEEIKDLAKDPDENWLDCLEPEGFEWSMPSGKIGNPVTGYVYKPAAGGKPLTKEQYISRFKVDPELAYQYMRSGAAAKERDDDYDIGGPRKERR